MRISPSPNPFGIMKGLSLKDLKTENRKIFVNLFAKM